MRYNELITEANYRGKFDTATVYKSDDEFKKAVKTKFGANGQEKKSKPLAGGAVYIMDPKLGIVGYRVPNADSESGYVWYAVKEPFMPATRGGKEEPAPAAQAAPAPEPAAKAKKAENSKVVMKPIKSARADIKGMVQVNNAALGGNTEYSKIIAYLKSKPGMDPNVMVNSLDRTYRKSWVLSRTYTSEELLKALQGEGGPAPEAKAAPKAAPKAAQAPKSNPEKATMDNLFYGLERLLGQLKSNRSAYSFGSYQTHEIEPYPYARDGEVAAWTGIRDWGNWEMPEGEEDDEDYDWEVLSDESRQKMRDIINSFNQQFPKIEFSFKTEEKNWITLMAKAK